MKQVAVVGCGRWGKNLVRNFAELGALRIVCDTDPAKLVSLQERFSTMKVTSSYAEVLRDEKVAGVVIATPAGSHGALAKEALLSGKDVFVEKPLALKVSDAKELIELADKKRCILMVGHILRYHPAVIKLKSLIDKGTFGKLYYIYSNRLNLGSFRTEENILWSFAPHDISAILFLLNEMPTQVAAKGGNYLNPSIPDVTVTTLEFRSGVRGHIFVSWLHPYKEQKMIVVGDRAMAVFDDVEPKRKLLFLNHRVEWVDRVPVPRMDEAESVPFPELEPLQGECSHFLHCMSTREKPNTDGEEGLKVLELLEACQESLDRQGSVVFVHEPSTRSYFAHETAVIDEPCEIGEGVQIWHHCHIMKNAKIGKSCILGQNVFVGSNVIIGDHCKIQNNVSLYDGVVLEDEVFCGPSMVFTNVMNPRSTIERKHEFLRTLVKKGATIGANATIVCGCTIGRYSFIGAGAVVTADVPDYSLVYGNPAKIRGWVCRCGIKLSFSLDRSEETEKCPNCGILLGKRGDEVIPIESGKI